MLEIFITKFTPLGGKSYKLFPKAIVKKAVINMENDDGQCFRWATTRALKPVDHNAGRIDKILQKQSEKYNWDGIEFPTKLKGICKFKNNNEINEEGNKITSKEESKLKIRFLDSIKFTLKSLDGLVKGLGPDQFKMLEGEMGTNPFIKKKGVFPYEFMTGFDKLAVNKLPFKKDFYSKSILTSKENLIINLSKNIVCCAITFLYYKRNRKTRLVRLWCDNALGKC